MFKNILREKAFIDRELELYRKERLLAIDREIEDYRSTSNQNVQDIARRCKEELAQYEHEFHSTKERRGIELALLQGKYDALVECVKAREEVVAADNNLLKSKDEEIARLNAIVASLIENLPKTVIQSKKIITRLTVIIRNCDNIGFNKERL